MLTPVQAAERLAAMPGRRPVGFDDPTEASYPYRWWLDPQGHVMSVWWRGAPTDHGPLEELLKP